MTALVPPMHGRMDPVYPCRQMPTRPCPAVYDGVCGVRPCARFESEDIDPWVPEIHSASCTYWCGSLCSCDGMTAHDLALLRRLEAEQR